MVRIILGLLASLLMISSVPSCANELKVLPLVPNHVGVTMRQHPSLCWMLVGRPADGATITFTLTDSHSIKPSLEVEFPSFFLNQKKETCHCINLKDFNVRLEPDIQYRWYVSIVRNPESFSQDVVAGGMIEYCSFKDCLIVDKPSRCGTELVVSLAKSGFWYDSISCLCDLIKAHPDDKKLRRLLDRLLKDGGLLKT